MEIEETLEEMGQLKYLIDNHAMVDATYNEWRNALWSDIDTESFDTVNKKMGKGENKLDVEDLAEKMSHCLHEQIHHAVLTSIILSQ